jgi:hypothetical protein
MLLHRATLFSFSIAAMCLMLLLGGCAESIHPPDTADVPDELLQQRLLGRWARDGYTHGGDDTVFRDELEFNDDGTFRYTRLWPNFPEVQRTTLVGTWAVEDGDLVQYWHKRNGRVYRPSTSQLLETRPRTIVFQNGSGPVESYYRRPRSPER